jgi:hypothetical protein
MRAYACADQCCVIAATAGFGESDLESGYVVAELGDHGRTTIGVVGAPNRKITSSIQCAGLLAQPAAVLAAITAAELARMRPLPGSDDTGVAAARLFTINGTIQLDVQAGKRRHWLGREQIQLPAHRRTCSARRAHTRHGMSTALQPGKVRRGVHRIAPLCAALQMASAAVRWSGNKPRLLSSPSNASTPVLPRESM